MADTTVNSTITEAITKAEEAVDKETADTTAATTTSDQSPTDKVEDKKEDKKEEGETEAEQAQKLWAALKNPETSGKVLEFLAQQAGYTKPPETKAEVKEQKNEILDILKEELGEEFSFLSDKLSKGIERILESKLKESTQDIRKELEQEQVSKLTKEAETASSELADKYFDKKELPKDVQKDMEALMTRYHPSPGQSVKEYLNELFEIVAQRNNIKLSSKEDRKKTDKNRNDVASQLGRNTSGKGTPDKDGEGAPKKYGSLSEAIKAAEEQVEKV